MKKKILFILLTCFMFFSISIVEAKTTKCEYDKGNLVIEFDEAGTGKITQKYFDEKEAPPWWINWLVNNSSGIIDSTETLDKIEYEMFGSCPQKIYTCKYEEYSLNSGIKNLFYGEQGRFTHKKKLFLKYSEAELTRENPDGIKEVQNGWKWDKNSEYIEDIIEAYQLCSGYDILVLEQITGGLCAAGRFLTEDVLKSFWDAEEFYSKRKDCFTLEYNGSLPSYNLACPNLNVYLNDFNGALKEYQKCNKTNAQCISKTTKKVLDTENVIKDYCSSILENHNYDGDVEQDCLEACMDIAKQTKKSKVAAGMEVDGKGDCGVSKRLIVWLSNILRWVKYILPVIVIIFGILDFIKAMGADKEDEMKKAQGKFIKRLIAAALVFLVPLILEFILDKMGFGYNSCGLF